MIYLLENIIYSIIITTGILIFFNISKKTSLTTLDTTSNIKYFYICKK